MANHPTVSLTPSLLVRFLHRHTWVWAGPAVAGLLLAGMMSLFSGRSWEATQGFLIRSEAAGFAEQRLGKFTDLSEMKAVQETVLEIARSQNVLIATLEEVGPPPAIFGHGGFPTSDDVVGLRENMRITPPGGAEFGMTEVFYLTVKSDDPERARSLATALAGQLERRLAEVRDERAASLVSELENGAQAAEAARDAESSRLTQFELSVGSDLAELRAIESPLGGQGELSQTAVAIEAALRESTASRRRNQQLLTLLKSVDDTPERLLATPSTLLASQPALDRLKTGLVNAQINAASLAGTRSDNHPMVVAANNRVSQLAAQLRKELPLAITGVEVELELNEQRSQSLRAELAATRRRLAALAAKRSEYSNLIAAVANQTRLVEAAQKQLADARATRAGAQSSSVLARIDEVENSTKPVGPGRATTTLAGGLAGLVLGLGLLFSFWSPAELAPGPSTSEATAGPFGVPANDQWFQQWPGQTAAANAGYAGQAT